MKPLTILLTLLSLTAYSQELPDDVLIHDSAETAAINNNIVFKAIAKDGR